MKAVIFARVSSKEQEEGHSLDAQLKNNRVYCLENELEIIREFKVVESSTVGDRPEFYKMMDFIKVQNEPIALVCHCADRLQRDFESLALIEKLKKNKKVEIHFSRERIIYDHNSDDFKYHLDVMLAHRETKQLGKRVKVVFQKKIEEGTICGDSPVGYLNKPRFDKKKEKAEVYIDPDRGHLVRKIFEMYSTGLYSMQDLCIFASEQGLKSKKGNKISKSQIEKVLKNPFYYGYMRYNGILHKHFYPKLISKELFDECQLVKRGRKRTKVRRTQKPFIFKGLLTCSHCGCTYSPELKKAKYIYMRPTKSQGECSNCYHINENKILPQIEEVLKGLQIPREILLQVGEELKKSSQEENKHQIQESKKLQSQYEKVQNRMKKVRELYIDEEFSKEEYNESMADLQVERQNIETRLQKLSKTDDEFNENVSTIFGLASKAYELFKSSDIDEKRRILVLLFPNLQMNGGKLMLEPRKPFDVFFNNANRQEWLLGRDSNPRPRD